MPEYSFLKVDRDGAWFAPVFQQGLALEFLRFPAAVLNYRQGNPGER